MNLTLMDDATLVGLARSGDRQAFGRLYEQQVDRVYRYVRFRVPEDATALDLTQEVFIRAWRALGSLEAEGLFGHWILRIAHNLVASFWQAESRRVPVYDPPDAPEGELEEQLEHVADPSSLALVDQRLDLDRLLHTTRGLSQIQLDVLALRFIAGCSLAETAVLTERSEAAVKKLQCRALASLRARIASEETAS